MIVSQGFVDADTNKDGVIDYEELVSVFNGMIQARKQQQPDQSGAADVPLSYDPALFTAAELEHYLKELFSIADENGDGVLQPAEMAKLLQMSGFEFTSGQILDIVAAADLNGDGVIEYDELVPVAGEIMNTLPEGPEKPKAEKSSGYSWDQIPEDEMDAYLRKLFAIADENEDGVLQPQEFVKLMRLSGLGFPDDVILEGFVKDF